MLCRFYLLDRRKGFVKLLSPFRLYFMQRVSITIYAHEDEENDNHPIVEDEGNDNHSVVEEEEYDRCNNARAGSSLDLWYGCGINISILKLDPCILLDPCTLLDPREAGETTTAPLLGRNMPVVALPEKVCP